MPASRISCPATLRRWMVAGVLTVAGFAVTAATNHSPVSAACDPGADTLANLDAAFRPPGLGARPGAEGFGGGDYPHSLRLPDGRVLWMFQDMHFSNDNVLGRTNAVHNGAIIQDGDCWTIQGSRGRDFVGDALTLDSRSWFWPLDGEIGADGNLWVFMAQMENPNGNGAAIGVRPTATWQAVLNPVTLNTIAFRRAPNSSTRLYGQSIVSDDNWSYLLGNCYRQFRNSNPNASEFDSCMADTYAARVPKGQFGNTPMYWNGSGWVTSASAAQPIVDRPGVTSALMNVQRFDDMFINVTRIDEWWGTDMVIERSYSIGGPWVEVDRIRNVFEERKCGTCGVYGAFLLPDLNAQGKLTIAISHGGAYDLWRNNAFLYRPTFVQRALPVDDRPLPAPEPEFTIGDERSGFEAVDPVRLVDTRLPDPVFARMEPGRVYELDLTGIAPDGATAAVLNLTAVATRTGGFIRAFACNEPEPDTSTLNPISGAALANAAILPIGDGRVCFTTLLATHFVVDLNGWMTTNSTVGLDPIEPRRVVDTRVGDAGGRMTADSTIEVRVVPANGDQTAVTLNITAVGPDDGGFITVWPCGGDVPNVSNLNTARNVTRPNLVNTRVDDGGNICVYSSTGTHLIIDILGEYSPNATARYTPVDPTRLLDSRSEPHRHFGVNRPIVVALGDIAAAQLNVTTVWTRRPGFSTAYACLTDPLPNTSNVNHVARVVSTNLALVVPSDGYACIFNSAPRAENVVDMYGVWRD